MDPPRAPAGRLVVCPTPIGNLEDVTLRALDVLRRADLIACEDTRHTRRLLDRHGISGTLISYHEHNETSRSPELVARMAGGALVALVSDAGMPLISDPGFRLVRDCLAAGVDLEVLPGPSAVITALIASGLPSERWSFAGFLPRSRARLQELFAHAQHTLVLAAADPARGAAVCRELTKLHEEVLRGTAAELADHYAHNAPRGEIVLVCAAAPPGGAEREGALAAVRALIEAGARGRPAAAVVGKLTGIGANDLYRALMDEDRRQ